MKSDVLLWMISRPEVCQTVFNMAKRHAMITYDVETKRWHGVEWKPE